MMKSMFSGVSGLRVHQGKMDVIAHNISNVNTVGYKSNRATFNEVFSQTLNGATGANEEIGRGGINPMQVGLGANISSIDSLMTQGAAQRTDRAMDLMIDGDGFFIVGDSTGSFFTRAGVLNLDNKGNLVISNGMKILGWDVVKDPEKVGSYKIEKGPVKPIKISGEKEYAQPASTTQSKFSGNLDPYRNDGKYTSTLNFYDSLGTRYVVDVEFKFDEKKGSWDYSISDKAYTNGDREKKPIIISNGATKGQFKFDKNGLPIKTEDGKFGKEFMLEFKPDSSKIVPETKFGDNNGIIKIDFSGLTQFSNENANPKSTALDGNAPGKLNGISIGQDGIIKGQYTNGTTRELGQIPLAMFQNPAGLERAGNSLFIATANSGDWDGVGTIGKLRGGVLEMSNVDLSAEFTEMITTQRGFQANSRLITTSDDMIQELVNLKR